MTTLYELEQHDDFIARHIGPNAADTAAMLQTVGAESLDALIDSTVPASIRLPAPLAIDGSRTEAETLAYLKQLAGQNTVAKSYIGMGYYDTFVPPVILRNVLENPRLVHRVYAVSAGNFPRAAGRLAQLPANGHGFDGHGHCQCLLVG